MDREKDRSADLGRDLPIFVGWEMESWTLLFTGRIPCTAVSPVAAKSCPFPLAALTRKRRAVSAYRSLIRTKQRSPAQRPGIFALWGGRWDSNPRSSVPQTDALGQLRYTHHVGAPEGTRTPGPLLRRQVLYPAELQAHSCVPSGAFCWSG